jgi:hypothetical protein
MYGYGNDIRVKNAKTNLVTMDSKVATTFITMCKSSGQDSDPIKADWNMLDGLCCSLIG